MVASNTFSVVNQLGNYCRSLYAIQDPPGCYRGDWLLNTRERSAIREQAAGDRSRVTAACEEKLGLGIEHFRAVKAQIELVSQTWNAVIVAKTMFDDGYWSPLTTEELNALHTCLHIIPERVRIAPLSDPGEANIGSDAASGHEKNGFTLETTTRSARQASTDDAIDSPDYISLSSTTSDDGSEGEDEFGVIPRNLPNLLPSLHAQSTDRAAALDSRYKVWEEHLQRRDRKLRQARNCDLGIIAREKRSATSQFAKPSAKRRKHLHCAGSGSDWEDNSIQ